MTEFFACVGVLGVAIVAIALLAAAFYGIQDWFVVREQKRFEKWLEGRMSTLGNRILSDAWWFSEDEATMHLVQQIGLEIGKNWYGFSVSELRNKWRAERAAAISDCQIAADDEVPE